MSPIPNFSLPVGLSVHSLQDNICALLLNSGEPGDLLLPTEITDVIVC